MTATWALKEAHEHTFEVAEVRMPTMDVLSCETGQYRKRRTKRDNKSGGNRK